MVNWELRRKRREKYKNEMRHETEIKGIVRLKSAHRKLPVEFTAIDVADLFEMAPHEASVIVNRWVEHGWVAKRGWRSLSATKPNRVYVLSQEGRNRINQEI